MATASVPNDYATGDTIFASELDANFQALVDFLNGSVVHKDGSVAMTAALTLSGAPTSSLHAATKAYVDALLPIPAAFTSYTPTITQSVGVAKTNNDSKYVKIGRFVFCQWNLTVTGAGVASNAISLSLPIAGRNAATDQFLGGACEIVDNSALTHYQATPVIAGAGLTLGMRPNNNPGVGFQYLGLGTFSDALAVGDVLRGSALYESAA